MLWGGYLVVAHWCEMRKRGDVFPFVVVVVEASCLRVNDWFFSRTTDTRWRHNSKKSEISGRCGRQNMLRSYPKNLELRVDFWPCSVGHCLTGRPLSVVFLLSRHISLLVFCLSPSKSYTDSVQGRRKVWKLRGNGRVVLWWHLPPWLE